MRIEQVSSFALVEAGSWQVVPGDERIDTLRVAQLGPIR
jgi:hypothetical protein